MRIDRGVDVREKIAQRDVGVFRPVAGKKVIEEDVADDAGVVAVIGDQYAAERGDGRVRVGECVDAAVVADPIGDRGREAFVQRTFDEVAREVADE